MIKSNWIDLGGILPHISWLTFLNQKTIPQNTLETASIGDGHIFEVEGGFQQQECIGGGEMIS